MERMKEKRDRKGLRGGQVELVLVWGGEVDEKRGKE